LDRYVVLDVWGFGRDEGADDIIENEKLPSELGWVKPAVELVKEDVHDMSERIANASSPIVEPAAVANARRGIGFGHGLF